MTRYGSPPEVESRKENEPVAIQQFLSDASQFQEADAPGTFVKAYRTRVTRPGLVAFCLITPLLLLAEAIFIYLFVFQFSDPILPFSLTEGITAVFFVLVVPVAVFWTLRDHDLLVTPIRRKIVVSLYTGGFIYSEGRKRQVVTWEQVRFIQRFTTKQAKTHPGGYKLKLRDAPDITLKSIISEVQELGAAVERAILQRLLPQAQADYAANKPITFPGLCFNQHVISKSEEQLPWQMVEAITLGSERLVIKAQGTKKDWMSAPIVQFPNVCVLEALLQHICEEKHVLYH